MGATPSHTAYANRAGVGAHSKHLPKHVAIIMDGNGRWATSRNLPRTAGHRQGIETVRRVIEHSLDVGVEVLTLFAFGQENWRRPAQEVRNLQRLFLLALRREVEKLNENNVKLTIIGDRTPYPPRLVEAMNAAEMLTKNNTRLSLNLAINYSGRWDMLQGIRKTVKLAQMQQLAVDDINEAFISNQLSLKQFPEPDLFIRTGGVQRISNFILWEIVYTELYFTEILWPDFTEKDYQQALDNFSQRERRFGLTSQQVEAQEC